MVVTDVLCPSVFDYNWGFDEQVCFEVYKVGSLFVVLFIPFPT